MGNNHSGNANFESAIDYNKLMTRFFDNLQEIDPSNYFLNKMNQEKSEFSLEVIQEKKEKEENAQSELSEIVEVTAQLREEQARSERWLKEQHIYAGLNLSGTEWQAMSRWFQDDDNVAAWEDQIMADTGMSRKDAKRVGGKMKRMYDLIDLQTQGKVLTPEQEKELNDLSNDSDVKKGVSAQQKIQSLRNNQTMTIESETRLDALGTKNATSVSTILADGGSVGEFNNVKSITPTFNLVAPDTKITPPVEIKVF